MSGRRGDKKRKAVASSSSEDEVVEVPAEDVTAVKKREGKGKSAAVGAPADTEDDEDMGEAGSDDDDSDVAEVLKQPRIRLSKAEREKREAVRAKQLADLKEKQRIASIQRLKYLVGQSEVFQVMIEKSGAAASGGKKAKADAAEVKRSSTATPVGSSVTASPKRQRAAAKAATEEEEAELIQVTRLTTQPKSITATMRHYQLEGLNWMISLHDNGLSGILADEMGLGKTLQTISLLGWLQEDRNSTGPHLILVPKSTLSNWMNELRRWCPTLRALKFHGSKEERAEIVNGHIRDMQLEETRQFDVLVTTYEIAIIEQSALRKIAWEYLVIDEAHRIKNENSTLSGVVRTFAVGHRLLLTGTPLQNNLHELWALLNFLLPDVFGSSVAFDEYFDISSDDTDAKKQMISQLHRLLRPFMLRRLKIDVANLPPKKETVLYVPMSECQRNVYKSILRRDLDAVLSDGKGQDKNRLQNILMQLRKVCAHPYLFEGVEDRSLDPMGPHLIESCSKLLLLDKLLPKLQARGSRVLIFSQMTRLLDILEDFCLIRSYQYCRIDGNSTYEEREDAIDSYNAEGSSKFVFLLSTRAGGLGINLATADIVILYDSDWNPQVDLQAQDRAHRIGQKKPVQVFRLITEGSVEEKILERAMVKLKLDAMVVQQGRLSERSKTLNKDEIMDMIQFGATNVFRAAEGSGVKDIDVDAILAHGEQKTKEVLDSIESAGSKGEDSLLNFKMDGGVGTQVFEGVDYSEKEQARRRRMELLNDVTDSLGRRERKTTLTTYNESQSFNDMLLGAGLSRTFGPKANLIPKEFRLPRMDPWKFYNRLRLLEIHKKQIESYEAAKQLLSERDGRNMELVRAAMVGVEGLAEERASLLAQGFADWSREDLMTFLHANKRFGRHDFEAIAKEVGKPVPEVQRYAENFWSRGRDEIDGFLKLVAAVEKGEASLREARSFQDSLTAKIAKSEGDPWRSLEWPGKTPFPFTRDHDRFLLCKTQELGSLNGDALRMEVLRCPRFRFDHFFRSRTPNELKRRTETVLRMLERELFDTFSKEEKRAVTAATTQKAAEEEFKAQQKRLEQDKARVEQELSVAAAQAKAAAETAAFATANPSMVTVGETGKYILSTTPTTDSSSTAPAPQPAISAPQQDASAPLQSPTDPSASASAGKVKKLLPTELLPVVAKIVNEAGPLGMGPLTTKVVDALVGPSIRQVTDTINEIAVKEKRNGGKLAWHLRDAFQTLLSTPVDQAFLDDYLEKAAVIAKKKQEREEKRKQTMAANTAAPGPAVVDMTNSDEEGAAPATTSPAKAPALKQATLNFQKPTGSA